MKTKSIIILSYIAVDSIEGLNRRIQGIINYLHDNDWKVTLYCPRYEKSKTKSFYQNQVITLRCWPRLPKNKFERILSQFIYSLILLLKLLSSHTSNNIIQIEQQPLALISLILGKLKLNSIVIDDFMFMSSYNKGLVRLMSYVIDLVALKTASMVATGSEHALKYFKKTGINHVYAPNGIQIPEIGNTSKSNPSAIFVGTLAFNQKHTLFQ